MTLAYDLTPLAAKQIGLIVLQADETLERDMRHLMPPEVEILVTRVPSALDVSSDSLQAMADSLTASAALLPRGAAFSAVGYGCTSGTAQIGAGEVARLIKDGVTVVEVTEPVSALIAACARLGVRRIGLISPYVASVSNRLRDVLSDAGITVTAFDSFNEAHEANVVRISPHAIERAVMDMGQLAECDAIFISCTNLRTLDVIEDMEARLGKPILSSNQVLAWHLSKFSGIDIRGVGRLFGTSAA